LLPAQAIIEYGAVTGSAGATSAGAGAGKSAASIFGKVGQALSGAAKTGDDVKPSTPAPAAKAAPAPTSVSKQPEPPTLPPDLTALVAGMDRAEMLIKVGKPAMSMTSAESSSLVETCWYKSGSENVTVTLRDGKVATISPERLAAK
jgi:hypothetical protein